jgi:hypothetical protein
MNPSQKIDEQIASLADWRGELMTQIRELVRDTAPELSEDFKWGGGVWTLQGKVVCAFSAFKDHVKFNFLKGAFLTDQAPLFNGGLESKEHRSLNYFAGDTVKKDQVASVIVAAVAYAKSH